MKNFMRNLLPMLFCTLLWCMEGCTTDRLSDPVSAKSTDESLLPKPRSIEDAVFNEGAQTWMIPQKDPYTLANFQKAFENLKNGNASQQFSTSAYSSIAHAEPLQATHYRLKIYPRNESEQWKIELMEDVHVSYIPFDYVPLTLEEINRISTSTRTVKAVYPEKNPYTVTYDNLETNDGPVDPQTFLLPILYVVWPYEKPLPDEMEYEIECEVFLPSSYALQTRNSASVMDADLLHTLENEAIGLALGESIPRTSASSDIYLRGYVKQFDNFLSKYVAVPHLKVDIRTNTGGSSSWTEREDGLFSMRFRDMPYKATVTLTYQSPGWKITTEKSTAPIQINLGTVEKLWSNPNESKTTYVSDLASTITRAVEMYYYGEIFQFGIYDEGIRIIALDRKEPSFDGQFTYSKKNRAYITIPDNYPNIHNETIGSVAHELGHFTMYSGKGGYDNMIACHKLLRESYGSYAGWFISKEYYKFQGYRLPASGFYQITNDHRQYWKKTNQTEFGYYSPLFVDLMDNYNQRTSENGLNSDNITNVPNSVIYYLAINNNNWESFKNALQTNVGVYFTQAEFAEFIAPYDYWFGN